jgi:hypothetical protein
VREAGCERWTCPDFSPAHVLLFDLGRRLSSCLILQAVSRSILQSAVALLAWLGCVCSFKQLSIGV